MASESTQHHGWIHYNFETSWSRHSSDKFAAKLRRKLLRHAFYNALSFHLRSSPPFFFLLRKWLQNCDNTHRKCRRQPRNENFWPKRVIYVGDPKKLTLVEGQSRRDDYLVLSHCWGERTAEDKKRLCTTSENYTARKDGFSYDQLPKTFQDAVQVTRALQKQYLWIDALCIIQEGPNCDWDSQAKAMVDIFANAYCTLAASSARGWGDGFLKSKPDPPNIRVQATPTRLTCTCNFEKDVDECALLKRGWVLQERVLSRRIIHFTSTHTYCECGDGVLCEQLTKLNPPFGKQYFFLDPDFPSRLNNSGYMCTVDFVQFLFRKYSTSGLSYATDRDVAIYSLVDRMAQVLNTEVRYGIFRCFLGSLLLWKRDENKTSPISYSNRPVPSWSWMAYPGGIDFILQADWHCKIPRAVDLGFIQDGEALNIKVRKFGGNCRMEKKGEEYIIFGGTEEVGSLWFDVVEQVEFKYCVVVSMVWDDKEDARKTHHILVIRKAGGEKENAGGETENAVGGEYEKVGVGKVEAQYVSIGCDAGILW
ncbi:heterokaryon incompatibility protein-domain-containing protein [Apodospora peruviana]|uniref:Heterokaryon incompatibility protein-domain-containing protein n=1 Tax=Apodospora peruviana TaxID=516989 RepID=A0AAE0IHA7_9PEZI|nr:heterokaryon incompatibility protein-domain-containing protein [Apodospora peruviana]